MFLIFNFDGTGNEPQDAIQEENKRGKKEDDNISNILKLHLMTGGNLHKSGEHYGESTSSSIDHQFYYQGVGTYGTWWSKALNAGVSPEKGDVASILRKAFNDFNRVYTPGDTVLVTGFSRGAALARRFVGLLSRKSAYVTDESDPFVFLLAFDTVASIGLPNLNSRERPDYDVVFEHGFSLCAYVKQAAHLISIDDKRKAFQPTLMNYDPERIIEIWFAGAHSDVGGGYYRDGLSDVALTFAINWLDYQSKKNQLPSFDILVLEQEQLNMACPNKLKGAIGIDDLSRNPNPLGKNHQQDRWPVVDWLTLDDRLFCVIQKDSLAKEHKPIMHHSVALRINKDLNYKPKSVINQPHYVWYDFNDSLPATGIEPHIEFARQNWKVLEANTSIVSNIYAAEPFNFTGVLMSPGQEYKIEVTGNNQVWYDAGIRCDADGWTRDDVKLGLAEIPIKLFESSRRVADADWFCLCACNGHNDNESTAIGKSGVFIARKAGELVLFANDLSSKYGNNKGSLEVKITLMSS